MPVDTDTSLAGILQYCDARKVPLVYAQPPTEGIVETIDLGGRLVLPGLMDAHIHVGYTGECAEYAQLTGEWRGS